ncbi:hypothetical protein F4561_001002 [Lipingzhangella halophila]|uniref:Uncharacterized protein n=1 Tax=Lipingzhangella halophila TaxID=1783352 RepID=A0A7W7RDV7_9ACTN|nr:DUF6463 family protein [Lipingzhangella halophila]MBB4930182.1 hypothetical protein [Lipingzhangella halophila]
MRSTTLNRLAGWAMVAIGVVHTAVFLPHPYWADWLSGDLWAGGGAPEAVAVFWALPGSFVPVLVVLGLLVARAGRRGEALPGYTGWVLGAWALLCVLLIGPSGFLLGLVPAALLIAANLVARRRPAAVGRSGAEEA